MTTPLVVRTAEMTVQQLGAIMTLQRAIFTNPKIKRILVMADGILGGVVVMREITT